MLTIKLISLSSHDTIEISLGDDSYTFDLYYYCADNTFLENQQDFAKGLLNFLAMIENWKLKIKRLKINETDFLPFDYSDEYISFFIISRLSTEEIVIQAAFTTEYGGWGINPSQLYLENFIGKAHQLDNKQYSISVNQLLQDIDSSIAVMVGGLYTKNLINLKS